MRDQDAVQSLEAQAGLHDLALRPLAAVDQKAVLIVQNHVRCQAAVRRWGGSRGT
jgi:hypothetical protein